MRINKSGITGIGDSGDNHDKTKSVDLRVIATILTGRLNFSTTGGKNKGDIVTLASALEWMTGFKPSRDGSTLQNLTDQCRSYLLGQFPKLEVFKTALPELDRKLTTSQNKAKTTSEWLAQIAKKAGVGDVLNVPKLPEGTFKQPKMSQKALKALDELLKDKRVTQGPVGQFVGELYKAVKKNSGIAPTSLREPSDLDATSSASKGSDKLAEDILHLSEQLLLGNPIEAVHSKDPDIAQPGIQFLLGGLSNDQSGDADAMQAFCKQFRRLSHKEKSLIGCIMLCKQTGVTDPKEILDFLKGELPAIELKEQAYLNTIKFLDDIGWDTDIRKI